MSLLLGSGLVSAPPAPPSARPRRVARRPAAVVVRAQLKLNKLIPSVVSGAADLAKKTINESANIVSTVVSETAKDVVKPVVSGAAAVVNTTVTGAAGAVTTTVSGAADVVTTVVSGATKNVPVVSGVADVVTTVVSGAAKGVVTPAVDGAAGVVTTAVSGAAELVTTLISPVVNGAAAAAAASTGATADANVKPTPTKPTPKPPAVQPGDVPFRRSDFPAGFVFGASTSSYQIEGGSTKDGKGPSVWDTFTKEQSGRIADRSNGDVAIDSYTRYQEDVDLLHDMGADAYRFSISWPRILPTGSLSGGINEEGIQYYNNLIDAVVKKGMKPFVTLFHWEIPQSLESEYQSFLSQRIVDDYLDFVNICFKNFGDRVKYWITFNEPSNFCEFGYASGSFPPTRCSSWHEHSCPAGDSATEPYIVGHHILLAHGAAVQLYRTKYQKVQGGQIGITLSGSWFEPYSDSKLDIDAVARAQDFTLGWFLDPLTDGDYPYIMRALVGDRLPRFTSMQASLVKGSFDFIGINYFTSNYVQNVSILKAINHISYETDSYSSHTGERNGELLAPQAAGTPWLLSYPVGLKKLLLYIKDKYGNPPIYITENGTNEMNKTFASVDEALVDDIRIEYHKDHLANLKEALNSETNVKGYFVWSLLDNFEWIYGYSVRFGLIYVDYNDGLKRYPKKSFNWFKGLLAQA